MDTGVFSHLELSNENNQLNVTLLIIFGIEPDEQKTLL